MIEFASVVSNTDHDIRAAEPVEQVPGRLTARRGAFIEFRMPAALVQMPLIRVIGIGRQINRSLQAHIQIMFDPRYLRFSFHQLDYQFHRIHTGGRCQPEQIFCLRILDHYFQGILAGKDANLLRCQWFIKGYDDPVRDQKFLTRFGNLVSMMRDGRLATFGHEPVQVGRFA